MIMCLSSALPSKMPLGITKLPTAVEGIASSGVAKKTGVVQVTDKLNGGAASTLLSQQQPAAAQRARTLLGQ